MIVENIVSLTSLLPSGNTSGSPQNAFGSFDFLLPSTVVSTARVTAIEPMTGGADRAMSMSCWIRFDNIGMIAMKPIVISDSTSELMHLTIIGEDDSSAPGRLRFRINGNAAGTILIYIQTAARILRNRWYHVVITYGANNSGNQHLTFDMYLNGVKQASPLRFEGGAYTTAYDAGAGYRLRFGDTATSAFRPFNGNLGKVAFFNKKLSDAEALTLYNNGTQVDVSTLSVYQTNGTAYFPLVSGFNSHNGSISCTNSNSSIVSKTADVTAIPTAFHKPYINNTRYIAFGRFLQLSGGLYYYFRDADTHLSAGKQSRMLITVSGGDYTAGAIEVLLTDPNPLYDLRFDAGILNGRVILFGQRYDGTNFIDAQIRRSTDGLTGVTFDSPTILPTTYSRYNFFGDIFPYADGVSYGIPFYEHHDAEDWRLSIFKTQDDGDTWEKIFVYENSVGEGPCISEGRIMYLPGLGHYGLFRDVNTGGMYAITSTDDCETWTAPQLTNLAQKQSNPHLIIDHNGNMAVTFMDRNRPTYPGHAWMSINNNPATIFNNHSGWNTPFRILKSFDSDVRDILGYNFIHYLGDQKYIHLVNCEKSSGVNEPMIGVGTIL